MPTPTRVRFTVLHISPGANLSSDWGPSIRHWLASAFARLSNWILPATYRVKIGAMLDGSPFGDAQWLGVGQSFGVNLMPDPPDSSDLEIVGPQEECQCPLCQEMRSNAARFDASMRGEDGE